MTLNMRSKLYLTADMQVIFCMFGGSTMLLTTINSRVHRPLFIASCTLEQENES